jgi:hypothetical protein
MFQPDFLNSLTRIEAEFREMPGMQLTERQMRRMWGLDDQTCTAIVRMLLIRGVLRETQGRTYALAATSR